MVDEMKELELSPGLSPRWEAYRRVAATHFKNPLDMEYVLDKIMGTPCYGKIKSVPLIRMRAFQRLNKRYSQRIGMIERAKKNGLLTNSIAISIV